MNEKTKCLSNDISNIKMGKSKLLKINQVLENLIFPFISGRRYPT